MATRLYFETVAPTTSPAFDASWEVTGSAVRRILAVAKEQTAYATAAAASGALNTPAGAVDTLIVQLVSPPISGTPTISGAIKGQIRAFESNAAANARMQCVIRVVSGDGSTVTGTLIASNEDALANEFNTALRNIYIPKGGSTVPSSVVANNGDRIVVELGWRKHESATTTRTSTFDLGAVSGGTDLPENETQTTQGVPWIEFADNITFQVTANERVTQHVVETAALPTSSNIRTTQHVVEVAAVGGGIARVTSTPVEAIILPTSQSARVTKSVIEVVYPSSNPVGTPRVYATIVG